MSSQFNSDSDVFVLLTGGDHTPSVSSDLEALDHLLHEASPIASWQPPPLQVFGRRRRLLDGLLWMGGPPVLSVRASEALRGILPSEAQFLPLLLLRGVQYLALLPPHVSACLDVERSGALLSPTDSHRVIGPPQYVLKQPLPPLAAFQLAEFPGPVFVRTSFVERVIAQRLTGIGFGAPKANALALLARGESRHVVPDALYFGQAPA